MPALRACWSSNDDTCMCLCVYIYMPTELQINKNYTTVVLMVNNIFIEYLLNNNNIEIHDEFISICSL